MMIDAERPTPARQNPGRFGGALATLSHGLVSASSFLCLMLVGRTGDADTLATYAMALAAMYGIASPISALLIAPTRVLAARLQGGPRKHWLWRQYGLLAVLAAALLPAVWLLGLALDDAALSLLIALLVALYCAHELTRSALFVDARATSVLLLDLGTHALRLTLFIGCLLLSAAHTHWWLLALVASLSLWPGWLWGVSHPTRSATRADLREQWKENWRFGRPVLLEAMGSMASTHLLLLLMALALSSEDIAALAIAASTLNLLSLAYAGLAQYLIPAASRALASDGYSAWRRLMLISAVPSLLLALLLAVLLTAFAAPIIQLLFGQPWPDAARATAWLALPYLGFAACSLLSAALHSSGQPQYGVIAKVTSGLLCSIAAYPMTTHFGFDGALMVYAAVPLLWLGVYGCLLMQGRLTEHSVDRVQPTHG